MYDAGTAVHWSTTSAAPVVNATESLRGRLAQGLGDDPQAADLLARWDRWGLELVEMTGRLYPDTTHRLIDLIVAGHCTAEGTDKAFAEANLTTLNDQ